MGTRRIRTALYSEAARHTLGRAVAAAREFAGWTTTAEFARALGRSSRAVYALESGEPTVGQSILHAVGIALGERIEGWNEDTPRLILEGKPAPPLPSPADKAEAEPTPGRPMSEPQPQDYPSEREYLEAVYWYVRHGLGISREAAQRGWDMAAAIYERRVQERGDAERKGSGTPGNKVG